MSGRDETGSLPGTGSRALCLLGHEIRLRAGGPAPFVAFGFFLLSGVLAPFALGSDPQNLAAAMPGYLWLMAAVAVLVALEGYFREDIASGRMEILRQSGLPVWLIALVMMVVYWLTVCLPLVLAAVPVALLMAGGEAAPLRLALSLLLGTPALAMLGGVMAAIAAALKRGTGLTIFLALPFFAPAIIFGTRLATGGESALAAGLFLAAFSLQSLAVCPVVAGLAIRQNME